jgi:GNAT superfamily N-acetyltransferase
VEYQIKDGREVGEYPASRLRGPATQKELEALQGPILPKKTRWTVEPIATAQARTFRQSGWPKVISENRHHRIDEPGMHVDRGNYANQLRYHDSDGILRGRLLHFRKVKAGQKAVEEWDRHRGQYEQAGHVLIEVDPKRWRTGIGTALLDELFKLRWRINLDKQGRTLAGAPFLRKYRERSGR